MKPLMMQIFFAKKWFWQVAFWGCSLCIGLALAMQIYLSDEGFLVAIFAGAFGGVMISYLLLHTLYLIRAKINGAPFHKSDIVQILVGKYKGHIVNIYEVWEDRKQVRVDLGEQAKKDVKDVFEFNEICRGKQTQSIASAGNEANSM